MVKWSVKALPLSGVKLAAQRALQVRREHTEELGNSVQSFKSSRLG